MDGAWLDLPWPLAGVDRSLAFQKQAPYTTPDALNVRTDGMSQYRERGGSRPGLGLAIRTELPEEIRLITKVSVVKAEWPKAYSPFGGYQLRDTTIAMGWGGTPTYTSGSSNQGLTGGLRGSWGVGIPVIDYRSTGSPCEITVHVRLADAETAYDGEVIVYCGLAASATDPATDSIKVSLSLTGNEYTCTISEIVASSVSSSVTSATYTDNPNAPGIFAIRVVPGTNTLTAYWRHQSLTSKTVGTMGSHYVSVETVDADSTMIVTKLSTEFTRDTTLPTIFDDLRRDVLVVVAGGLIHMEDTADSLRLISTDVDVNNDVDLCAVDREQKLFIADYGMAISGSGGTIAGTAYNTIEDVSRNFTGIGIDTNYVFEFINSDYSQNEIQSIYLDNATGGTFTLTFRGHTTGTIAYNANAATVTTALEDLATVDDVTVTGAGSDSDPWLIEFVGDHEGNNVDQLTSDITNLTGTSDPSISITTTQSGAGGDHFLGQYVVTDVTATTLTFAPALPVSDGYSATIGSVDYRVVRSAKIFDPKEETLTSLVSTSGVAPAGCRLVALYRDRIVWAGGDLLPHVWYASRQGDPYDYDYSQEDSAAAVMAQASIAGQLADPITAMIPHSDECLIFGCYTSLWIMRGDPGYGGTLDQLSRKIGIVSAKAWCRTPDDMVVFLSADGLYVMPAGCAGFPASLSRERLPDELLCLNSSRESIHLEYDTVHRGVHIFVTKRDESASPHWWFDWESKSFWRMSLQTDHEPFAVHERIAWDDCPVVLVGGRDGYIRYFDRQFQVDDGNNEIESYCDIGPIHLDPENFDHGLLTEMIGVLGDGSGDVDWSIRTGHSAQEAYNATAIASGTWTFGGMNPTVYPRIRGVSAFLRLSNNTTTRWFMERISAIVKSAGRRRM